MKKIILILLLAISFASFGQTKPTYSRGLQKFNNGNWLMRGNYDTTTSTFADSLMFVMVNANPQIWGKTKIEFFSPLDANSYVNTDSSYYLKGVDLIRYKNNGVYIGSGAGRDNTGTYSNLIGNNAGNFNTGSYVSFFGNNSGNSNQGNYSVGMGQSCGASNTGDHLIAIGTLAGYQNSLDSVLYIGAGDTNTALIYGRNKLNKERLRINGDLYVDGDVRYDFPHAIGSADSIAWATGSTQNVFYKINTGSFVWHEADGITGAGDSATIVTAGDYKVSVWLGVTTTNANDMLQVKIFTNGVKSATSLGRFFCTSMGAGVYPTRNFMWYKTFAAGDKISIRISNTTGARAMTISDYKLYIEKVPE